MGLARSEIIARLAKRAVKVASFVNRAGLVDVTTHPRPWAEAGTPYYVMNPVVNKDGAGGYTAICRFDSRGIPWQGSSQSPVYRPLVMARYGMKMLSVYKLTKNPSDRNAAMRVLEPLLDAAIRGAAWVEADSVDKIAGSAPSAMVQGVCISAILRMVDGAPTPRARSAIEKAMRPLLTSVAEQGTVSMLRGRPFLEEFPRHPSSHVLNGAIYGLFGLYDLADALNDHAALEQASRIEESICTSIREFVAPLNWSYYALNVGGRRPLASMHYHNYHRHLAEVIANRSGSSVIQRVAKQWAESIDSVPTRMAIGALKISQASLARLSGTTLREG